MKQLGADVVMLLVGCGFVAAMLVMVAGGVLSCLWHVIKRLAWRRFT